VGDGFHGRRTASGEVFNAYALTAAHKTLRFGTQLRVTNVRTGKSVVVRINDRGPYAHGRGLDLSYAAAQAIGLRGVGYVVVEKV
jgi:rare lipoprotein A